MKNAIIMIFLFISITISGATYYVSPGGSDSNSGSSSAPWKTLAYACSKATASGDIIHVNAGTYLETNQCVLAVGVSIEGDGVTSYIKSHYASTRGGGGISGAAINLSSSSEGTNGNQHISGIKLDGDNQTGTSNGSTAFVGILVFKRSNVKIHDCTIVNFYTAGIAFHGTSVYNQPTTYATGNELYNCTMQNCVSVSDIDFGGAGMIEIGGQDGILIHDNTMTQTGTGGYYGDVLITVYYDKGVKYYNNKSYKPDDEGGNWNFHLEIWDTQGGWEVYNNEFHGSDNAIDIAGHFNLKGSYAYSWYIHDNLFTCNPTTGGNGKQAIQFEDDDVEDVWIYRNHFVNWPNAINATNGGNQPTQILNRIYVAYNIFDYGTWTYNDLYQNIFRLRAVSGKGNFNGFYIYNNVIKGPTDANTTAIKLQIESGTTITNINIKNNIIINNANGTWLNVENSGSISNLYVDHNILYNNTNNNDPVFTGNSVSNYEFLNNQKLDPLFVSSTDFHLQAGSPAIEKGLYIQGLTIDYEGKTINNPPNIGAFESGLSKAAPPAAIPVCQNSVVTNAHPSLLEMTYNMTLANSVPAASAFKVLVNSAATAITNVVISGAKVQLILASEIKFGDIVTISYTKPSTNPLKSVNGGEATNISALNTINNVIDIPKGIIPASIKMTIYPNPVHQVLNILFESSGSLSLQKATLSGLIIRIFDMSGKLFIEKLLEPGISNFQIPINLKPGIYTILMLSGGMNITAQKMMVY
jgi:uncharacterized repeat protein (TIGR02059 family)